MRYLLDVNALLALLVSEHSLHDRTLRWVRRLTQMTQPQPLVTCAITELGFLRIVSHAYGRSVAEGRGLLAHAKEGSVVRFEFISDDQSISELPPWVLRSQQVTDGHLVVLAKKRGASFATLDEKIPGAFLIPK